MALQIVNAFSQTKAQQSQPTNKITLPEITIAKKDARRQEIEDKVGTLPRNPPITSRDRVNPPFVAHNNGAIDSSRQEAMGQESCAPSVEAALLNRWRLDYFVADLVLSCKEGKVLTADDKEPIANLFSRRSGPISAAIAIAIEGLSEWALSEHALYAVVREGRANKRFRFSFWHRGARPSTSTVDFHLILGHS